jgi:hypothetical protein
MLRIECWLVGWLARLTQVVVALPASEGLVVAPKRRADDKKSVLRVVDAPPRYSWRRQNLWDGIETYAAMLAALSS